MVNQINTLIVENDPTWQDMLRKLVRLNPLLNLTGVCASAMDAYALLAQGETSLILCDIEMPEINGLEFIRSLKRPPLVIFVTAYPDHAIPCYEVSPIDFLLKPIAPARFLASIEKVRQRLFHDPDPVQNEPYFFIRDNHYYVQVLASDVLYMQAQENILQIVTSTQIYQPFVSIAKMEEQLKTDTFLRVHRSYLVNRTAISRIGKNDLMLTTGQSIPIGDQYRAQLHRKHLEGRIVSR
ncbi:LytR/AlgR family response regulator transcription factor [Spirosoma aerolatum]|uniref:LytR/AlgR family response regulator transcription factor n=1 Tax=Spirosoma aerolatum TaxID=1211326 RepID=UPI0009ADB50B|nr:LytTR family DNA-binding domain-containing protein [Spirosoma aerolatum]